MTPATQWAVVAIFFGLAALFFAWLSIWTAKRALRMSAEAQSYRMAANYWRQHFVDQGGRLGL